VFAWRLCDSFLNIARSSLSDSSDLNWNEFNFRVCSISKDGLSGPMRAVPAWDKQGKLELAAFGLLCSQDLSENALHTVQARCALFRALGSMCV
jgi:hypothetical protein